MAKPPLPVDELIRLYGPHPMHAPPMGWEFTPVEADRLVPTHCCFCSQQCGLKLKVKDEKVIGFEPWYAFPFNQGKLCPKGIRRYLQNEHPDRLLHPLERTDSGFQRTNWDRALDRTVSEIRRIQSTYGKNAFAMLSGVSLSNEKSYLVGKFARVALQTANLDYNGRLCMVSAGAANKKIFGIDRAGNPWSDIPQAKVLILAGTNVAECSPITTDYVWQARENGAKIIVIDPRMTPIARTADLFLPVRPGGDSALFLGILQQLIVGDWCDETFLAERCTGWEAVRERALRYTPEYTERLTGVPRSAIEQAARIWAEAETGMLLHARGIEHHSKGVENCMTAAYLCLALGRVGRPGCGYGTITGQGNGQGGREHGHKCDQLPGNRDIENPEHRRYIADIWGIPEPELPGKGLSAQEIVEAIDCGQIRGLISICFNPLVSLPNAELTRRALSKLEFYAVIDFFMSETAHHADIVLPGSLHEEDEGTSTNVEARVIRLRKAVDPPGEARVDWHILCDLADRLGKGQHFQYERAEEIFNELRVASKGGATDYYGITYEKIEQNHGIFWPCPDPDHPGTPRLFENQRSYQPDGKFHLYPIDYRPPAEEPDAEYPILLTTGRVVSQYLSGTQTRRIGPLVDQYPEPKVEIHPRLAERLGVKDGRPVRVTTRRGEVVLQASVVRTIRPDTVFIPYHWSGAQSANLLTNNALDPISKIPEYKVCACRVAPAAVTEGE